MLAAPSSRRRVLFVDDDPQFLQTIERVIRLWSKDAWEILTAPSASAALALLQDRSFNLVVIDVCMPVVDGLQFLSIVHRRFPDPHKVILTGHASEAYRTACLSNGAELFLEKPRTSEGMESIFATLDELTRFRPEPGFRGVLRRVGLMDVIQMECLNRSSSVLAVKGGQTDGAIYIREGAIVHAEAGTLQGMEAFNQLLTLMSGDFRLNPYVEPAAQTIDAGWEGLLMDAAQRRDEGEAVAVEPPEALAEPDEAAPPEASGSTPESVRRRTEELLICSEAGDVLHAWHCPNIDLRINFLEFLSQKARVLRNALPLGSFERAEFQGTDERLVAQISEGRGVLVRTGSGSETEHPIGEGQRLFTRAPSAMRKIHTQRWFQSRLEVAGLLAAGLQFSDRSGFSHSLSPPFGADGLETMRRCVSDIFQVLSLQRFEASRVRWISDQTVLECACWADKTCLGLVLSRQTLDLDPRGIERLIEEFLEEGARF